MSSKKNTKDLLPKQGKSPAVKTGPIHMEADRLAEEQRLAVCICMREQTTVHCSSCGFLTYGRILRECSAHKNVVFLYDLRACSKCQASSKKLQELAIDLATYRKLVQYPE